MNDLDAGMAKAMAAALRYVDTMAGEGHEIEHETHGWLKADEIIIAFAKAADIDLDRDGEWDLFLAWLEGGMLTNRPIRANLPA